MPLHFLFHVILEFKYRDLNAGHMKVAPQQFLFKTVLRLKPEECSRTQSTVTLQKLTHYMRHSSQKYIFLKLSCSSDPKKRPNVRDSCKPLRDAAVASSLPARHPGAVPRVSCTRLIQLSISLYSETELFISVYSWAGYENHISKQDLL